MATLALDSLLDGRYRLGPVVGRGASAEVREALDESSGEDVAIKFVAMDGPDARVRATSEIGALERLDHPNLLTARGHGEIDGYVYVVTDLVRGQTLEARIHHERLSPTEVATIGSAVAAGLTQAHHLGVVHRDLKPANILLGDDGTVRLADFGIARLVGQAGHTSSGLIRGSAHYLAPEQVEGGFISPATDVYALGLVVLEALTGQRAFEGTPMESAQARLRQVPTIPSELSEAWRSLISEMTAREPGDRPTSADVTDRLDRLADGSSSMPVIINPDSAPTSLLSAADLADVPDGSDGGTTVFPPAAVAAAGGTRLGTLDAPPEVDAEPTVRPEPTPEPSQPPIPPPAAAVTGTAAFGTAFADVGAHWDRVRRHRHFPIAVAAIAIALLMAVAVARADSGDPSVAADEPIETTTTSTTAPPTTTSTTIAPAFPPGPAPDAPDDDGHRDKRDKHDDD